MADLDGSIRAARRSQARREAPTTLALGGSAVVFAILLDLVVRGFQANDTDMWHLVSVGAFIGAWLLLRSPFVKDATVPWIIAGGAVVLVGSLLGSAVSVSQEVSVAYALLAMAAYSPFVLDTAAMLAAAVPMLVGYVVAVGQVLPGQERQWVPIAVVALLVGFAIQHVRMRAIDALARATRRIHVLATRDDLTGLYNRVGLDESLPGLVAAAARHGEPVFVLFVDVDGLKAANDEHGHELGDRMIAAVARVLRAQARGGDLVVRWGGDEFVVVGSGTGMDAPTWERRLNAALADLPDADLRGSRVSAGYAEVATDADLDTDELLAAADAQMYRRRRERRAAVR